MPDVAGKTGTFAEQMLRAANLNVQFSGDSSGKVVAQDVQSGTTAAYGTIVTLTMDTGAEAPVEEAPAVEENIDPQMLVPQVDIDSELLFSDITPAFRKDLNRFQPFGPGNTAPVFATCGVSNHGDAKLVGMDCEHLRMDLMQRQKPNTKIQAIAFQQPTHYEWVRSGRPIDVCYQIVENHYRGTVTTQLRIKDIKPVLNR